MQSWDALNAASYEHQNMWYNNQIKTEPGASSPLAAMPTATLGNATAMPPTTSHLENYLRQHQQQHHYAQTQAMLPMDTTASMTPSPHNTDHLQQFFDGNLQQQLFQQQFQQAQQAAARNQMPAGHLHFGFNPLTPPGLPNAISPNMPNFYNNNNLIINNQNNMHLGHQTPSPQLPTTQPFFSTPLDLNAERLQAALTPRNTPPMDITPPKSPSNSSSTTTTDMQTQQQPKISSEQSAPAKQQKQDKLPATKRKARSRAGNSIQKQPNQEQDSCEFAKHPKIQNSSDEQENEQNASNMAQAVKSSGSDSEDDDSIYKPVYNSHGKMKTFKCKACGNIANTKVNFWLHAKTHMKPEKVLTCPKCPFVTELKHHLEYHMRKHANIKPFQCSECSYTCVNKSMLNSHRKSHSDIYQYQCSECEYVTKYCHSFKLHLRKYEHDPGTLLDENGKPNPSMVIDVYGTRRGPKNKSTTRMASDENQESSDTNANNEELDDKDELATSCKDEQPSTSFSLRMQLQQLQQHQNNANTKMDETASEAQDVEQNSCRSVSPLMEPTFTGLMSPLARMLQQNQGMAFLPYLKLIAEQQRNAMLAQFSPQMQEAAALSLLPAVTVDEQEHDESDDELPNHEAAMDLSQTSLSTENALNLKVRNHNDTPSIANTGAKRRKGRVLKLASQSPEHDSIVDTSRSFHSALVSPTFFPTQKSAALSTLSTLTENKTTHETPKKNASGSDTIKRSSTGIMRKPTKSENSSSSPHSSSGNSSNSSNISDSSSSPDEESFECKYCNIIFKDDVLYSIHMGYHSCEDAFRCNMCGEKCEDRVAFFLHMARNSHA